MNTIQRLEIYRKNVLQYALHSGMALAAGILCAVYAPASALFASFLVICFLSCRFNVRIGWALLQPNRRNGLLTIALVSILSIGWLSLKIWVNEGPPLSCTAGKISEGGRMFHYFLYSIWMPLLIWEFIAMLLSKRALRAAA